MALFSLWVLYILVVMLCRYHGSRVDWVLARLGAIRLWPRLGVGSSGWPKVGSCWKLLWRVGGSFERRRVGLEASYQIWTHWMARFCGSGLWRRQCAKEEEAQLKVGL